MSATDPREFAACCENAVEHGLKWRVQRDKARAERDEAIAERDKAHGELEKMKEDRDRWRALYTQIAHGAEY